MQGIVGGVFALEKASRPTASQSLLSKWTADGRATYLFHNARSCVRYVVADLRPRRLWLPAYLCPEIEVAVRDVAELVLYYPLDSELNPDGKFLVDELRAGDAVLGINYWGKPAAPSWSSALGDIKGVIWIEDCAQTLDTGGAHFGDVRIYSPRKMVGVPDGGVLVDRAGILRPPELEPLCSNTFMQPYIMRAADPEGRDHRTWYARFQEAEASMTPSNEAMCEATRERLEVIDAELLFGRRSKNYLFLFGELEDLALFSSPPVNWVPFGFPLVTERHEELWTHLCEHRVFAARHWRGLPSPADEFERLHLLADSVLTIPCDQRYTVSDMARVAELVREICP